MTIVNRRNAVVGWLTIKAGKVVARRQAKRVVRGKLASLSSRNGGDRSRRKERAGSRS
jgi:hypothetical protein